MNHVMAANEQIVDATVDGLDKECTFLWATSPTTSRWADRSNRPDTAAQGRLSASAKVRTCRTAAQPSQGGSSGGVVRTSTRRLRNRHSSSRPQCSGS